MNPFVEIEHEFNFSEIDPQGRPHLTTLLGLMELAREHFLIAQTGKNAGKFAQEAGIALPLWSAKIKRTNAWVEVASPVMLRASVQVSKELKGEKIRQLLLTMDYEIFTNLSQRSTPIAQARTINCIRNGRLPINEMAALDILFEGLEQPKEFKRNSLQATFDRPFSPLPLTDLKIFPSEHDLDGYQHVTHTSYIPWALSYFESQNLATFRSSRPGLFLSQMEVIYEESVLGGPCYVSNGQLLEPGKTDLGLYCEVRQEQRRCARVYLGYSPSSGSAGGGSSGSGFSEGS